MLDSKQGVNPNQTAVNAASSNADSVPAQNAPSSTPLPAAPDVNNAQAGPAAPPPIAPAPATVGPTVTKGQNMSAGAKPSMAKKVLQAATGGQTTDFAQGPNGPVPVKRDLTTGELARRVLASVGSVFAAGAGGALAAKQHRPFELAPGTSLGDIQNGPVEERQKQAQEEFNNTQTANEATLRAHRDAMEQQKAIADLTRSNDEHLAAVQARTMGSRLLDDKAYEDLVNHTADYSKALAMPGAEVMKDADGKELNFDSPREAQEYAIKHPEVIHGSTNGNTKFGVIPVVNPYTGSTQFIDYPADRHDIGIANYGQKIDDKGEPMFDKDGSPIPDGTVLDPKTKKPTVLTQTVTPDQARTIKAQTINQANVEAQLRDRDAQARERDSQAKKNGELSDAIDVYNSGNFAKMTDRQKQLVARMTFQEQTLAAKREKEANDNLAKVLQTNPADSPEAKTAQAQYDQAKTDYDDATEKYGQLTGNTAGVRLANAIIRTGIGNTPWATVDKQIQDAQISDDEKQAAKAKVWNSLSPAQQAAANPTPQQPAAAGAQPAAGAPATPAPNTHVFDLNAWVAKNPNGDKAAAIKAAQDQGYTVKQ